MLKSAIASIVKLRLQSRDEHHPNLCCPDMRCIDNTHLRLQICHRSLPFDMTMALQPFKARLGADANCPCRCIDALPDRWRKDKAV